MLDSELGWVVRAAAALTCLALSGSLAREAAAQTAGTGGGEPPPSASSQPAPSSENAPQINLSGGSHMDLTQPPPPPLGQRTYHYHDGFYARVDAGLGALLGAKASGGGADVTSSGLTLDYDLMLGGSVAPGFAIGGALVGGLQLSGDWELDGGQKVSSANLNSFIIGPAVDGFPDPDANLHFGGALGLSRQGIDVAGAAGNLSAIGVGGAFWAGSGVWVAPDWSLGGLLRLDAMYGKDGDTSVTSIAASLMFSVLYN